MFSCFKDRTFLNKFIKIALPVMLASLITFLAGFIDNIMVGSISNETVSGVYAANEITLFVSMYIMGLVEGAGIFIEQYVGAKDDDHIKQCFRYKIVITTIAIIVLIPILFFFGKNIISLFCQNDTNYDLILDEGNKYFSILLFSYIPQMIGYSVQTTINETGRTKYSMIGGLIAVLSNVLFNALFIYVFKMGGIGAAIATVIARSLECLFLISISIIKKFEFMPKFFEKFYIDKKLFKAIFRKSIFLFLNEIGWVVGTILMPMAYAQRDGVLSAISINSSIANIFQVIASSLNVSIGVLVGFYLGQDKFEEAKDTNKKIYILSVYISLFFGLLIVAFSSIIPNLYPSVTRSQKDIAIDLLIINGALMIPHVIACSSYFTLRVGGKTGSTFFLDTGLMMILYIPLSWILVLCTNLNIIIIYLIITSLDIVKAGIGLILVGRNTWARNLTIKSEIKGA